ncbi:MAG: anti-sigma factor [Deltaproteobacteria bacterium]|nr:anti-sigma factor [Deltaproteobacteria bacterium]
MDRELPVRKRVAFRMHLAMCQHCRRFVRQLRATIALLRHVDAPAEPAEPVAVDDSVLAAFRARRPQRE